MYGSWTPLEALIRISDHPHGYQVGRSQIYNSSNNARHFLLRVSEQTNCFSGLEPDCCWIEFYCTIMYQKL